MSILLISLFCAPIADAKEHLIFSIDLIRHGDRTPIHEIPKSPHTWKEGLGELTPEGMKQEFQLGVELRKRYIDQYHLLPPRYLAETIYVRSTDLNRTLMSAQSLLLGLYPLGTGSSLPAAFQPIPIHTVPKLQDDLLNAKPSSNIFSIAILYVKTHNAWKNKTANLKNAFAKWYEATGLDVNDPFKFDSLSDTLNVRALHHVPFPQGISSEEGEKIISLGQEAVVTYFKYKQVSYPMGHHFLRAVADYLKQASDGKSPLKYVLFSGHDSSIMSVMNTLGTPLDKMPRYASHLNFALFNDDKKQYLKISFNDEPVMIPACGGNTCTLEQFYKLANQ